MATKFLEPGGDATFNVNQVTNTGGFWSSATLPTATLVTDIVHGTHDKSLKFLTGQEVDTPSLVCADAGTRVSFYMYIVALPNATDRFFVIQSGGGRVVSLNLTSGGVLQLINEGTATQIGSNGATLATGQWYRISMAYTITSSTVNRFEIFVNGVSSISTTNSASMPTTSDFWQIITNNATWNIRTSDHYTDNSSALTDPGNIWVTAKRPVSNGTTNGFTTQIGSGGSGYGTGHSPQVNERPLDRTNGWSMIGAGSAITEEYNIEGKTVGDIDISAATIIDFIGWVYADALASETASIIVSGALSNISLTSSRTMFTKAAGSSTYPAGGTDIGIKTTTALTTVSLYECGIMFAYIPATATTNSDFLIFM